MIIMSGSFLPSPWSSNNQSLLGSRGAGIVMESCGYWSELLWSRGQGETAEDSSLIWLAGPQLIYERRTGHEAAPSPRTHFPQRQEKGFSVITLGLQGPTLRGSRLCRLKMAPKSDQDQSALRFRFKCLSLSCRGLQPQRSWYRRFSPLEGN